MQHSKSSDPPWSWWLCGVSLIKHSIKAIPTERPCATMFELGDVAGSDSLWRLTPEDRSALKPKA